MVAGKFRLGYTRAMPDRPTTIALIVAAGSGQRSGQAGPKQYALVSGKPMLRHAVERMAAHSAIDAVRVIIGAGQEALFADATEGLDAGVPILGAESRQGSVMAGLDALRADFPAYVLIHDAARPFCPPQVVDRLIDALRSSDGAVPVLGVADTVARSAAGRLGEAVDRDGLVRVQTPQAFAFDRIWEAHRAAPTDGATDDATIARASGLSVASVEGDERLSKITFPADFERAEAMFAMGMISRTGTGFDVHAFAGSGPLVIGGITVQHERGLTGHSDADVALHALTDALLGAAAEGDIGTHFPPSEERWRGAASHLFVEHARDLIAARGGIIDHVDVTVICEAPRIGPHRDAMRDVIAAMLRLRKAQISVKATTTERLGFTGRGEGIAAQAVATVRMES